MSHSVSIFSFSENLSLSLSLSLSLPVFLIHYLPLYLNLSSLYLSVFLTISLLLYLYVHCFCVIFSLNVYLSACFSHSFDPSQFFILFTLFVAWFIAHIAIFAGFLQTVGKLIFGHGGTIVCHLAQELVIWGQDQVRLKHSWFCVMFLVAFLNEYW